MTKQYSGAQEKNGCAPLFEALNVNRIKRKGNPLKTLVISILTLTVLGCSEPDKVSHLSDSYSVHGAGQVACTEYNEKARDKNYSLSYRIWLQGFFTAINTTGSAISFEINDADLEESIEYINTQCASAENAELWIAQLANIFWRTKFKEFEKHATQ